MGSGIAALPLLRADGGDGKRARYVGRGEDIEAFAEPEVIALLYEGFALFPVVFEHDRGDLRLLRIAAGLVLHELPGVLPVNGVEIPLGNSAKIIPLIRQLR